MAIVNGIKISNLTAVTSPDALDLFNVVDVSGNINNKITFGDLSTAISIANGTAVLTTDGDILIRASGVNDRLAIGTENQVLTVSSGAPVWEDLPTLYSDPLTTSGDIVIRNGSSSDRLAIGTSGQVLTVSGSGLPEWAANTAFADPMTVDGEIIIRDGSATVALTPGADGTILTMSSGVPAWQTNSAFIDPMSSNGDIVIRASSTTTRLPIGTSGQVLTVSGSGLPAWETATSSYTDPLTTDGDIVIRSSSTTTRLPIGTEDQVLTVSSGVPVWQDNPTFGFLSSTESLGTWNMDTTSSVAVTFSGIDYLKVVAVFAWVRHDTLDTIYFAAHGTGGSTINVEPDLRVATTSDSSGDTVVTVARSTAGGFNDANFDSVAFDRGSVTILYTV